MLYLLIVRHLNFFDLYEPGYLKKITESSNRYTLFWERNEGLKFASMVEGIMGISLTKVFMKQKTIHESTEWPPLRCTLQQRVALRMTRWWPLSWFFWYTSFRSVDGSIGTVHWSRVIGNSAAHNCHVEILVSQDRVTVIVSCGSCVTWCGKSTIDSE